jgi:hypothetical protein
MIVDDLHLIGVSVAPLKTHPPLVIDADAMLPCPVARQLLQPIARRDSQISEFIGSVQDQQLTKSGTLKLRRPAPYGETGKDSLRVTVSKALDHEE